MKTEENPQPQNSTSHALTEVSSNKKQHYRNNYREREHQIQSLIPVLLRRRRRSARRHRRSLHLLPGLSLRWRLLLLLIPPEVRIWRRLWPIACIWRSPGFWGYIRAVAFFVSVSGPHGLRADVRWLTYRKSWVNRHV